MSEVLKEKTPLPLWRRILFYIIVAAIAAICVLMVLDYFAGRQLGYEFEKIKKASEPLVFSDLIVTVDANKTADDASIYYYDVLKEIWPGTSNLVDTIGVYSLKMAAFEQVPDDVRKQVVQNLAASELILEKLDKGADVNLAGFDIDVAKGAKDCKARLDNAAILSLLLSERTLEMILQGKDDAAVDSVISMVKLNRILDFQPVMLVHGAKVGLVYLACRDIRLLLLHGHPSEKELMKLQKVLAETIKNNYLEKIFLAERVYQIEVARNLIPEAVSSRLFTEESFDFPERIPRPSSSLGRLRLRWKLVRYFHGMSELIKDVRKSWPEPLKMAEESTDTRKKLSRLLSSGDAMIRSTAVVLADIRCAILAIAIERYRIAHGKLPVSLADVTGVGSIPLDPFTGKELLYRYYDDGSYVVYSVGINRRDDGGSIKADVENKWPLDMCFKVQFQQTQ